MLSQTKQPLTAAQTPKKFNVLSWGLFFFIASYILIRSIVTEPISDEAYSFYYFIEYGTYWGENMHLDANNHLLNSILSTFFNHIFGFSFFTLRLANLLSFCLYFWSLKKIADTVFPSFFSKSTFLVSTVCIPFILEYFGFSRGYGLSMAFLVASIYQLLQFQQKKKLKHLIFSTLFSILEIYANLTMLIPVIINLGCAGLFIITEPIKRTRSLVHYLLILLGVGIALIPIYRYSIALKEAGALYFGSADNWWNSMVKSLVEVVFFRVEEWMKYPVMIFYLALISLAIVIAFKQKKDFIQHPVFIFLWMLLGNFIAIELMAKLLHVNYPSYRVGMHLILFTLFLLNSTLSQIKKMNFLLIILWLVPIGFIAKMNLHTSTTTPSDRMSKQLFTAIQQTLDNYSHTELQQFQVLNYSFHARNTDKKHSVITTTTFNPFADFISCYANDAQNIQQSQLFSVISTDAISNQLLFKRRPFKAINSLQKLQLSNAQQADDFLNISMQSIPDSLKGTILKFHVKGTLHTPNAFPNGIAITFAFFDKEGKVHQYSETPLQWIHGSSNSFEVIYNINQKIENNYSEWRLLIWNKYQQPITIENGSFELLQLKE